MMRANSIKVAGAALAVAMVWAGAVQAASLGDDLAGRTEKLTLSGRKGPSLFKPGFAVGEYTGWSKAQRSSANAFGSVSMDKAKASITIEAPSLKAPVTAECKGGQGRLGLGWITFKRDKLVYVCTYGGGAPAGAEMNLAASKGKGLAALTQPQRAGELDYGSIVLRADTKFIGGLPITNSGSTYVFFRPDGAAVGALQQNGLRPTFYLPKKPGPERDAVAVLALSLFFFGDPGPGG